MKTIAWIKVWLAMILAGLSLTIGGCHETGTAQDKDAPQTAGVMVGVDVSRSAPFLTSPAYADNAIGRVGQIISDMKLGDGVSVAPIGFLSLDHGAETFSLESDRKHRLPMVRKLTEAKLRDLLAQSRQQGGDGATNILYTLKNSQPRCSPRSVVVLLSDMIEESEAVSVGKALATGQPIRLPPPDKPYLKGCSVVVLGIGMSPIVAHGQVAQTLPDEQLQALIAAWRNYFQAAGVRPADMTFRSIL